MKVKVSYTEDVVVRKYMEKFIEVDEDFDEDNYDKYEVIELVNDSDAESIEVDAETLGAYSTDAWSINSVEVYED